MGRWMLRAHVQEVRVLVVEGLLGDDAHLELLEKAEVHRVERAVHVDVPEPRLAVRGPFSS